MLKVFITDGKKQPLLGSCLYFTRLTTTVALTKPSEVSNTINRGVA